MNPKNKKSEVKKKKKKNLVGRMHSKCSMESTMDTFAFKVYEEQLREGLEALKEIIQTLDKDIVNVLAIVHDKDTIKENFWEVSKEKPHIHIIGKYVNGHSGSKLKTVCNMLSIEFRNPEDNELLENHGAEKCVDFAKYACYLTHDTDEAKRDYKAPYELNEIISNLSMEEIKLIREGYQGKLDRERLTDVRWERIDFEARELGYKLGDFEKWYNEEIPFQIRKMLNKKALRESYEYGIEKRKNEDDTVNRLCIFIYSKANSGKTYTSELVAKDLGLTPILKVNGGKTGKFDRLQSNTKTLIIDDYHAENMLNMSDNYFCEAYKRQSGNQYWTGLLLIVTANKTLDEWIAECNIPRSNWDAMHSRFFECTIEVKNGRPFLACNEHNVSKRGTAEEQLERLELFKRFRDQFNKRILEYKKTEIDINYSGLDAPTKRILLPSKYNTYDTNLEIVTYEEKFIIDNWETFRLSNILYLGMKCRYPMQHHRLRSKNSDIIVQTEAWT